jgi:hypothetical protein
MSNIYSYGPPVTVVGSGTRAASAVGEVENGGSDGGSPQVPPGNAATNAPAGGSPSYESGAGSTVTLASIAPTTIVHGGAPFTLTATGTNFNPRSVIVFNGVIQATTFVSATSITASIDKTNAVAGTVQVAVQDGAFVTPTKPFIYT